MRGGILKPGRASGPRDVSSNVDPVCGMELKERDPQRSSEKDGKLYFFCSRECKQTFDAELHSPEKLKSPM